MRRSWCILLNCTSRFREWCVFHVDRVWTSTRGRESGPCGRMWTEEREGGEKPDFCGRHKWMAPYILRFPPIQFNFLHILQLPPIFEMFLCFYTKFSSPYQNVTFPSPKLTKPFVSPLNDKFSHKMGMKISASYPMGWTPLCLYKSRVIYA